MEAGIIISNNIKSATSNLFKPTEIGAPSCTLTNNTSTDQKHTMLIKGNGKK
jgi:hypothetical protein